MIVLDTEQTGLKQNEVCQLAYIRLDNGEMHGFNEFYAVDAMNEYATEVNGLTVQMLRKLSDGRRFKTRAAEIAKALENQTLVGHNVASDIKVLRDEFQRAGVLFAPARKFCTMNHFTHILNINWPKSGRPKYPSLEDLCDHLRVSDTEISKLCETVFGYRGRLHDARYDVCATLLCIQNAEKVGMIRGLLTEGV